MNDYFDTKQMANQLLGPKASPAKRSLVDTLATLPADKKSVNWGSREGISAALDPIRKITGSPLGLAAGLGLAGAGLGYGLWRNIVQTGGSLGRIPIKRMTGMSDEEYDAAMEELADDKR